MVYAYHSLPESTEQGGTLRSFQWVQIWYYYGTVLVLLGYHSELGALASRLSAMNFHLRPLNDFSLIMSWSCIPRVKRRGVLSRWTL